ncbi:MAG: septum site-determining protein MinC [Lachnospiraceae bacterium]
MGSSVIIKSFQNGISVILDKDMDFSQLLEEVGMKFRESGPFFKDAKMAISFEGRILSLEEEKQLIRTITENCGLHIVCLVGKNEETNQTFLKAIEKVNNKEKSSGQFYRGNLTRGETLEMDSSIVIIGDVNPGAEVIAKKDIVIIGGLYGEAYAGADGESGHFIAALEMSPENLKIGDLTYKNDTKQSRWPIRPKMQPKIACEKGGKVVIEPVTKELLNMLPNSR